jgi:hypothetical protein
MFYFTIIILILILLIILWRWSIIKNKEMIIEGIDTKGSTMGSSSGSTEKKPFDGTFNGTFNGRMAISDQYQFDKTFDDAVYYPNEYEGNSNINDMITTGWVKCKQECNGNCVEYGVHGTATCFSIK